MGFAGFRGQTIAVQYQELPLQSLRKLTGNHCVDLEPGIRLLQIDYAPFPRDRCLLVLVFADLLHLRGGRPPGCTILGACLGCRMSVEARHQFLLLAGSTREDVLAEP